MKYNVLFLTLLAFIVSLLIGSVLHELGHLAVIVLSGSEVNHLYLDISKPGIMINYAPRNGLVDTINGYFGGLFSASVMALFYLRHRGLFQARQKERRHGVGLAYFGVIGIQFMQGLIEGAFRSLYLNNVVFTSSFMVLGTIAGAILYIRLNGDFKRMWK